MVTISKYYQTQKFTLDNLYAFPTVRTFCAYRSLHTTTVLPHNIGDEKRNRKGLIPRMCLICTGLYGTYMWHGVKICSVTLSDPFLHTFHLWNHSHESSLTKGRKPYKKHTFSFHHQDSYVHESPYELYEPFVQEWYKNFYHFSHYCSKKFSFHLYWDTERRVKRTTHRILTRSLWKKSHTHLHTPKNILIKIGKNS